MKIYMLKSEKGYYVRRGGWTQDPQRAAVWTSRNGPASAKGHLSHFNRVATEIVELDAEFVKDTEVVVAPI